MAKKKAPQRVGETHVQAVRDTFPGVVLDATWQAEDQVTITVPKDMLPDVVEFLYYGRGGWLPNMVANDEPAHERQLRPVLPAFHGGERPGLRGGAGRGRPPFHGVPERDPTGARLRVERARGLRHVRPAGGRPARRAPVGAARRTGRPTCTRCARTPWTTASVRPR